MGVRAATPDDLGDIARIHKARFGTSDYILGQYSVSFINKFYASFLGQSVFLVHVSDRGVDGFVLGGERAKLRGAERAFLWKNIFRYGLETLLHPRLWPGACRSAYKLCRSLTKKLVRQPGAELPRMLSIAVDEAAQGSGTAEALGTAFEADIASRHAAYQLSVLPNNRRAVRFYEKLGLTLVEDASPDHLTFQREFKPPGGSGRPEP